MTVGKAMAESLVVRRKEATTKYGDEATDEFPSTIEEEVVALPREAGAVVGVDLDLTHLVRQPCLKMTRTCEEDRQFKLDEHDPHRTLFADTTNYDLYHLLLISFLDEVYAPNTAASELVEVVSVIETDL
jgi:hypothetical protein